MATSQHEQVIRTYADAFATCDVDTIVACVSDDLVWELNGNRTGEGKTAFAEQMRTDLSSGSAEVTIEDVIEQGDVVVALNRGRFSPHDGEPVSYLSAEVYTFDGDRINRIRTYQPMG